MCSRRNIASAFESSLYSECLIKYSSGIPKFVNLFKFDNSWISSTSNINTFLFFFLGVNIFFLINSLIQFSLTEYLFDNSFIVPAKDSKLDGFCFLSKLFLIELFTFSKLNSKLDSLLKITFEILDESLSIFVW